MLQKSYFKKSHIYTSISRLIAILLTVSIFVLTDFVIPVKADNDDEYISFNDFETAQAYKFWSLYGLNADTSSTYTQTYTTTGTTTEAASITLSGTNTEGGTFNLSDINWYESVRQPEEFVINASGVGQVLSGLDITINANPDDNRDALALQFGACTAIGSNDNSRYSITCESSSSSRIYNNTEYEVEMSYNGGADYFMTIKPKVLVNTNPESDFATGYEFSEGSIGDGLVSVNLTESVHESGSISSTGTITTTTTTTNTNSLKYVYPAVKGQVTNTTTEAVRFQNLPNNPYIISVLSPDTSVLNNYVKVLKLNGDSWEELSNAIHFSARTSGGYFLNTLTIYTDDASLSDRLCIELQNQSYTFIPVYVGYKNYMSNGAYRYIYGSDRTLEAVNVTNNLIENGNTQSQEAISEADSVTDQLVSSESEYHSAEVQQLDSMDAALNDIDTTDNITSNSDFLSTANWVTLQYNRLVNNTPLELVITFSLILGLALVFIGKVR